MTAARDLLRRTIPFPVRARVVEVRRLPRWLFETRHMALRRASGSELEGLTWLLAGHASPLERVPGFVQRDLQLGKEANVRLAARLLDGLVVEANQVFSHHHAIGRPTRWRGFVRGLELRDGHACAGIGGGLCQVSNSVHWIAVRSGMRIVERHRHGFDLFPDHARTVPFGCGATVAYNSADLRFENPLSQPVVLRTRVEDGAFVSELWTSVDPGIRVEVEEVGHRFFRDETGWMRENRLRRRITRSDGSLLVDEEVAHNRGRVLYEPSEAQLCGEDSPKRRS